LYFPLVYNCVADQAQKLLPQDCDWNFEFSPRRDRIAIEDASPAINFAYLNGKIQFVIENIFVHTHTLAHELESCFLSFLPFFAVLPASRFLAPPRVVFFFDGHLLLDISNGLGKVFALFARLLPLQPFYALLIQLSWRSMAISLIGLFALVFSTCLCHFPLSCKNAARSFDVRLLVLIALIIH